MLELKNVDFKVSGIDRSILSNLNLTIYPGDFVVIIGGNGAGKSSLIKLINGLYRPTRGTIRLNGQLIESSSLEEHAQTLVTLTQEPSLSSFGSLTVWENCLLASLRQKNKAPQLSKETLKRELYRYNKELPNHLSTPVERLSGGQRQSLALAMSLLITPSLLLLDEHTSALDPKAAAEVMKMTHETISERAITTLMITHELSEALLYGNRLIALKEGHLIFEASGQEKAELTREKLLELCF